MKVPTGKGQKQQSQEKEDHTAGVKTMCKENHSSGSTQPATHQSTDPPLQMTCRRQGPRWAPGGTAGHSSLEPTLKGHKDETTEQVHMPVSDCVPAERSEEEAQGARKVRNGGFYFIREDFPEEVTTEQQTGGGGGVVNLNVLLGEGGGYRQKQCSSKKRFCHSSSSHQP